MTNQINGGGPAMHMPWNGQRSHEGISIRDYFAAAALQGLMASVQPGQIWSCEEIAVTCHRMADAMLKAREVKP